jgi:hypothetical protein
MSTLSIITNDAEPNTRLTKKQLLDLENKLEESNINSKEIITIATILRDNTISSITENELDRMIYFLENNKGKRREIESIISRIIMMSIPSSNGGKRNKRIATIYNKKRCMRFTRKSKLRYQK